MTLQSSVDSTVKALELDKLPRRGVTYHKPGCTCPWERKAAVWDQNPQGLAVRSNRVFVRLVTGWAPRAHVVWVQAYGPPPAPGFGNRKLHYVVHHDNEEELDDRLENLKLMTFGEHSSLHMKKWRNV